MLLDAKRAGHIIAVKPSLDKLQELGFRLAWRRNIILLLYHSRAHACGFIICPVCGTVKPQRRERHRGEKTKLNHKEHKAHKELPKVASIS
ncbi:DUF3368 domain-containing protein [Methanothrix soehngenii]|uniref:DUF3368 domain-containing protein n=1 Tax=Methanothrix soehngenii TaxID=2223 RepID=UPI00192B0C80